MFFFFVVVVVFYGKGNLYIFYLKANPDVHQLN